MSSYIITGLSPVKAIIPTNLRSRPRAGSEDGRELDGKYDYSRSGSRVNELLTTENASFFRPLTYHPEYCKEHRRIELVPSDNHQDLRMWYLAGLHPRFSIRNTLLKAGQLVREVIWRRFQEGLGDKEWVEILKASRTPRQFLRLMEPHLFVNYYAGRRRIRVQRLFKERCDRNAFNVGDFFRERNQELRRLMLRHGIRIADVLGRLKFFAEDEEGKLYEEMSEDGQRVVSRYLYVKCPSTGQEYLLSVPFNFFNRRENGVVELDTPKKARRWTFRLRQDAEFVAEA